MPGFYVGHGRHWEFFRIAGRSDADLMALFYQIHLHCQANVLFRAGGVHLISEPNKELAIALLMQGNQISSAFPYVAGGHVWPIEVSRRKDEDEIEPAFRKARPRLLGAIFDAVSAGLKNYGSVNLGSRPRMARSARWITACEMGIPGQEGEFLKAYDRNREELTTLALDHSTVATALLGWFDTLRGGSWEGTASDLHGFLVDSLRQVVVNSGNFPKAPNKLSAELRRIAPTLRKAGMTVELSRSMGRSKIRISRPGFKATPPAQKPLSEITGGKIPFDLPYDQKPGNYGKTTVFFRPLSDSEFDQLDLSTQSLLAMTKDHRASLDIPAIFLSV